MKEYLRGLAEDFPEEITETTEITAASNLFNIRDDNKRELINETRSHLFHQVVA